MSLEELDPILKASLQSYSDGEGKTVVAGRIGQRATVPPFYHDPEAPTHLNLRRFAEWRTSKCFPRNHNEEADRRLDLDQGTLELTGEAGEVAEVILNIPVSLPEAILCPKLRVKLIDEVGDVLFCCSWLADAWGVNPMRINREYGDFLNKTKLDKSSRNHDTMIRLGLLLTCQTGLLANSAKKVLVQNREQDIDTQFNRLDRVCQYSAMILSVVGASVYEATARNVEKLDARFPPGYALGDGGIRTGLGA